MRESDEGAPTQDSGTAPADLRVPMTRRELLRRAALGGTVLVLPGALAACVDEPVGISEPRPEEGAQTTMSGIEPFIGEIALVCFNFPPKNWAFCNGQLLPIAQNQALFSLLGTTYGGNGTTNFALPDLRGRVPISVGGGHALGTKGGSISHTLTIQQLPAHTHTLRASPGVADTPVPTSNRLAAVHNLYSASLRQMFDPLSATLPADVVPVGVATFGAATALTTLAPGTVSNIGGSQPHENRQPYLALNYIIALQGIFPTLA